MGRVGCLSGSLTRVGEGLTGEAVRLCDGISGSLTRVGRGLRGEALRLSDGLSGRLTRVGRGLTGYVSVVCTSNRDAYMMVTKDTIWLTPDMIAEQFEIYSNVKWKID